jgi:hypothetical protein
MLGYRMYGLTVESDWALPECLAIDLSENAIDVRIIESPVPAEGIGGVSHGPFCQVKEDQFWLQVPDIARFLVTGGHTIAIEPHPGIDNQSIRLFLLGSAIGALLFQRGHLVLHGNAIEIQDGCVVCVGHSGAGKSTLAAAFMKKGYRLLADDVVVVDSQSRAVPGFPRIKIWGDTAMRLGINTQGLERVRPVLEKYNRPLGQQFCDSPLPIKWIYVLNAEGEVFEVQGIEGMERFKTLRDNTYRVRYVEAMALQASHMQQIAALSAQVRLASIKRPISGFQVDALIDCILKDMAEQG